MAKEIGKIYRVKKQVQGVVPSAQNSEYFEPLDLISTPIDIQSSSEAIANNVIIRDNVGSAKVKMPSSVNDDTITNAIYVKNQIIEAETNPIYFNGRNLKDILGGTNVKDTFAKLRSISSTGDFSKLRLGDYIDLIDGFNDGESDYTWNERYQNLRCQIVAFDHYYRTGDQDNSTHHVVMQFKNCYRQKRMHNSDSNNGGYNGNELQTFLNGSVKNGLVNAIGITPTKVRRLIDTYNGWIWVEEYVFLPTEVEVIGHQAWGHSYNSAYSGYQTGSSIQYPIFTIAPQSRIKFYNGSRQGWWVASVSYNVSGYFVSIVNRGNVIGTKASDTNNGVAPAFCI